MVEYYEVSALTNSRLERMSSIETKLTERINSIEWQLQQNRQRVNELHWAVEKLVKQQIQTRRPSAELQAEGKSGSEVAKVAGETWKYLSLEEKAD